MRKRREPTDEERRQAIAEMMERWSWRETLRAWARGRAVVSENPFKLGDIVTRCGDDRHVVIAIGGYNDITVRCIGELSP